MKLGKKVVKTAINMKIWKKEKNIKTKRKEHKGVKQGREWRGEWEELEILGEENIDGKEQDE